MQKVVFILLLATTGFYSCSKNSSAVTSAPIDSTQSITVALINKLPEILHESSGLCFTNGNLWSFGDSGNPNYILKIDSSTGAVIQTVIIQNFPNADWEDITADSLYIYVGDFGNNDGNRKDLKILRVKKSDLDSTASVISVNADAINFSYADQQEFTVNSNTNFDCEAMISFNDSLYLFTKDGGDLQTRCYKLSKEPGTYSVAPLSNFNTQGKITGAAYNPSTNQLALLGYMNKKVFPFIWFFKNFTGNNFFDGDKERMPLTTNNTPWQTEGIDYISANRMFLSCESTDQIPASLYYVTF